MQASKPKILQTGEETKRLTTRQIQRICTRHGWVAQMERVSPAEIDGVDRRIVNSRRYCKNNAVMVARSAGGTTWLRLGWKWDIETLNEAQIVERLKALEQSHNNELTGFDGTTGTQA